MVETMVFVKALSVTTLFVGMLGGLGYWIYSLVAKKYPDLKYTIKYRVLRKKYNEEDVRMLIGEIEAGVEAYDLQKTMILTNNTDPKEIDELMYIYRQLKQRMKGGNIQ